KNGGNNVLKSPKTRRLIVIALSLIIAFSFMVPAFAVEKDLTHTVTIYVQEAIRDENDAIQYTYVYTETPITVTVDDEDTLKFAVQKACLQTGSIITNDAWVPLYPEYLFSLDIDGIPYENDDNFSYDDPAPGWATYTGLSWMYFDGDPSSMPASSYSYPITSLGATAVTEDMTITLSFEFLTFIWQY
ncbi:MAG: hypothetical protein AAGU23_07480, partial [Bacillota bacterium]